MSRKGKSPITIPSGVEVAVKEGKIVVKGPKGTLDQPLLKGFDISQEGNLLSVVPQSEDKSLGAKHGLLRSLVNNMVIGTSEGFLKELELIGVGFRAALQGEEIDLQLGFSHPTKVKVPEGLSVEIEKSTLIKIRGADKHLVGQFAANIRSLRRPEPYKGKGIRYKDEYVRRKAGKAGKK